VSNVINMNPLDEPLPGLTRLHKYHQLFGVATGIEPKLRTRYFRVKQILIVFYSFTIMSVFGYRFWKFYSAEKSWLSLGNSSPSVIVSIVYKCNAIEYLSQTITC